MRRWSNVNLAGQILIVMCVVNLMVAVLMTMHGLTGEAILSTTVAALCGVSTFNSRYDRYI